MADEPVLVTESRGRVRVLRLNRPERKNALDDALGWAIVDALEQAMRDEDVFVIGITGAGDAFCSGLDLRQDTGGADPSPLSGQDRLLDDLGWVGRFPVLMRDRCDKPVVAGVNGVAVGAGFSLAITANIRRMAGILDRLLGYSRASSFASELEDIDMRRLVEQVVREQSIDPRVVSIGELPPARADRVVTHILLSNLLGNAVKHGRSGRGLHIEIGSAATASGPTAYFVRDHGPGLTPELAERLFKPLPSRVDTAAGDGLGLGLAIAARAVERHGGKIWAESAPRQGATFWFTLRAPPPVDED
jgi:signal transduction histidine kinase